MTCNYAATLDQLKRSEEAKPLLRRTMPVAQRVLGENHGITLKIRWCLATALYGDPGATLDELREAVNTLAETESSVRRVLGGAHPYTTGIEEDLRNARVLLAVSETPSTRTSA